MFKEIILILSVEKPKQYVVSNDTIKTKDQLQDCAQQFVKPS
jgi:hypothetical protein